MFVLPSSKTPGNHWSFYSLHSFAFSRISHSWNRAIYIIFSDWLLSFISVMCIKISSRSFHELSSALVFIQPKKSYTSSWKPWNVITWKKKKKMNKVSLCPTVKRACTLEINLGSNCLPAVWPLRKLIRLYSYDLIIWKIKGCLPHRGLHGIINCPTIA